MSQAPQIQLRVTARAPFADGAEFGEAGSYERVWGQAEFAIDPDAAGYRTIVDLDRAPRREDGRVTFAADFFILKPRDAERGNRRLLYEVGNRGTKLVLQLVNDAPQVEHPASLEHAGNGYLLRRGYSVVWSAWQGDIAPGDGRMTMRLPVPARDGASITGLVRTEFAPGYDGTGYSVTQRHGDSEQIYCIPLSGNAYTRSYESVSTDNATATLTCREYETDPRIEIPTRDWSFACLDESGTPAASATHCFLPSGFRRGWIYELIYTAKNPAVLGLGFTGVRDLVSFLRYESHDCAGGRNPLRADTAGIEKAYGWGCSQSARFLREFVYRGFNQDTQNRAVFDAINPFVSGAGRVTLNYRFAQPGRYPRQHFDHLYASDQFPFAYSRSEDPLTGKTDGILKRPQTDPFVIHTQSSAEYWQRRGSLVHTDSEGNDLADHPKARVYLFASAEHSADPVLGPESGATRFPTNPLNVSALQRALLDDLDEWVTHGTEPPASRVPRRHEGTAVTAAEVADVFPTIPAVVPPTSANRLFVQDHGSRFDLGEFSREPPHEDRGREYRVWVPAVDELGNERVGIRGVELEVPTATYTGWNFRPPGEAGRSMAAVHGSYLPFVEDRETREARGDSRPAIEERYESSDEYVRLVEEAARRLVAQRLLLAEDAQRFIERARKGTAWRAL